MDNKAVIVNQPNAPEGEISRATKSIEPLAKIVIGALSFIGIIFAGSKTWIQIDANTSAHKELKEQVTRQYSTNKSDYEKMQKDFDEELDVLEAEIDKLKEQVNWHLAYEAALKDIKK